MRSKMYKDSFKMCIDEVLPAVRSHDRVSSRYDMMDRSDEIAFDSVPEDAMDVQFHIPIRMAISGDH